MNRWMLMGSLLLPCFFVFAQPGIIINEVGNVSSTSCCSVVREEFIELLVLGSSSNPAANVDLSNWLIDDNNGDFEGPAGTPGIGQSNGHLRLEASCFSSIPPGSIIVIYNDGNSGSCNSPGPADDLTDANGDGVYIIPVSSACIGFCDRLPCNGIGCPGGGVATESYLSCTYTTSRTCKWTAIGFRDAGDAVQVRDPGGGFFHGFAFGDVATSMTDRVPTFPNGNNSFNIGSGNDYGYTVCGNVTLSASFNGSGLSAGTQNSGDNGELITTIREGSANYTNIIGNGAPVNCNQLLPVELVDFQVKAKEGKVLLNWETASEYKNAFFEIQRSLDGKHFTTIGKEVGGGTSFFTQKYAFIDDRPFEGLSYYRLRQVDIAGTFSFSPIRVIKYLGEYTSIRLEPVPALNTLTIKTDKPIIGGKMEIWNMVGQLVMEKKLNQDATKILLDISSIPHGNYVVRLNTGTKILSKQFIKI